MSLKDEYSHGSPLDHEHCQTCVQRTCNVRPNHVTSCDIVNCPRGCQSRYHECKGAEHLLLCPEDRVPCINKNYGCPLVLPRKNLSRHLSVCPASIVICKYAWRRHSIHYTSQNGKNSMLLKKTYTDCGQLDTALAMRDHRVLLNKLLAAPQSLSEYFCLDGGVTVHNDVISSRWDTKKSFLAVQKQMWRGQGLFPESADEPAVSVTDSQDCKDAGKKGGHSSNDTLTPGPLIQDEETSSFEHSSSALGNIARDKVDSSSEGNDRAASAQCDEQESLIRDGQALDSILSVSLGQYEGNFLCQCSQQLRRDEFALHSKAVHDDIQPNINGWMEQRCPLAYLGCPFSFRRFRPAKPGFTVTYSWLLESFGITSESPQADSMHRIPDHLLPSGPERAAGEGDIFTGERSSEFVQAMEQQKVQDASGPSSSLSQQESELVAVVNSTADTTSLSGTEQTTLPEDEFSSMVDSINVDKPAEELPNQGSSIQKRVKNLHCQGSSTSDDTETQSAYDNHGNQTQCNPVSTPAQHQDELQTSTSQISTQQKQNQTESKSHSLLGASMLKDKKQVIYTAVSARSCVRVDHIPVFQPNDEKTTTPAAGLSDLPYEILCYLMQYLDSFSLYNLSLVSHVMREVCGSLLQERGIVSLIWEKQKNTAKESWQVVGKCWRFSTSFEPVERWTFTGFNPISNHLVTCPYNQDCLQHSEKFSLIPLDSTPLGVQIRDMLQKRLEERSSIREPRRAGPDIGHCLEDVLIALGGTLPP